MEWANLIIDCIGLQDVTLEFYKADKSNLRLEIWVKQSRDKCRCSGCKGPLLNVKDYRERTLRAPPMGPYREVKVHLRVLRAICDTCQGKPKLANVIGIHPQFQNFTFAMAEVAGRLMEETTCEAVARLLRANSKTLWDLDQWRMRRMTKDLQLPLDLDISHMSADEVHFRTIENTARENPFSERWTTQYLTNLVCSKASKVIANAGGRDALALAMY